MCALSTLHATAGLCQKPLEAKAQSCSNLLLSTSSSSTTSSGRLLPVLMQGLLGQRGAGGVLGMEKHTQQAPSQT